VKTGPLEGWAFCRDGDSFDRDEILASEWRKKAGRRIVFSSIYNLFEAPDKCKYKDKFLAAAKLKEL
jgi:hypothetical protein